MPTHLLLPELRQVASGRKQSKRALRKQNNIPPLFKAARKHCLDCCCGSGHEVRLCHISTCALWPYRFGRNPDEEDLQVPVFDKHGNLEGYRDYEGFPQEADRATMSAA